MGPKPAVAHHLGAEPPPEPEAGVGCTWSGPFVMGEDLMTFAIGDRVEILRRR